MRLVCRQRTEAKPQMLVGPSAEPSERAILDYSDRRLLCIANAVLEKGAEEGEYCLRDPKLKNLCQDARMLGASSA